MTSKSSKINAHRWFLLLLTILSLFLLLVIVTSFKAETYPPATVKEAFIMQMNDLQRNTRELSNSLRQFSQNGASAVTVQERFYAVKSSYKKIEYLLEYLDPELAKSLNGAPLPKVLVEEADYQTLSFLPPSFRTFPPEGLQVLEELLFAEEADKEMKDKAVVLALSLEEKVLLFTNSLQKQSLTDKQILESLREQVLRVMTMGITGFDAPAAGRELEFVAASLEPVLTNSRLYAQTSGKTANEHSLRATQLLEKAVFYLRNNPGFDTFDRLHFIREYADPAYGAFTALQEELIREEVSYKRPVNNKTRSLFSHDFLNASFYAKQDQAEQKPALPELGKILFFDPALSANNQRSCASCHNPSKAFTDGLPRSLAFDFKGTVQRNSPTLLNAVFSTAYFSDSRSQYLQDQVPEVLLKEDEFHASYEEVVEKLQQSPEYKRLFEQAFEERLDATINVNTINRAIAAYVQSLVALDAPFDRYMRHETELLNASAKRGFNLFMGKAGCGTCHFAPIFNGSVPPRFLESESEVLGVTESADFANPKLDPDPGKAGVIPAEAWMHSFKTPTVRNVALTSPYMHNGAYANLHEVMEFYNSGGGAGLGLDVPNQTLPSESLNLTEQEKEDIIAFMHSLSDTTSAFPAPKQLPRFSPKNAELNKRVVGGVY